MSDESPLYVGITRPVEVRKALLESSKYVLSSLQLYEQIKDVRAERMKIEILYDKQVTEVQELVRKLRARLPKVRLEHKETVAKKPAKKPAKKQAPASELHSLQKELNAIEKELEQLD